MNKKLLLLIVACAVLAGCANRGMGPQGGPKDSIPPFVVMESPLNGSMLFKGKKIEISFNEYVQLDNVVENVLISPPQQKPPVVKAIGKRVIVTFEQDLEDSTTYTIDFGPSICDFTEKNPMTDYSFSFSTGETMDSLEVSGYVVNAANLNPVQGVVVGIHRNMEDSAFSRIPFTRISKSDEDGYFTIRNIHEGAYRLYALQDNSRDYLYQPGEAIAWNEELVTPFVTQVTDSVDSIAHTEFGPANLVLWFFEEDKTRQYFQRASRPERYRVDLQFAAPQDSMPTFRALRPSEVDTAYLDSAWVDWMPYTMFQVNNRKDTIVCWITDSAIYSQDTLFMEMTYFRSDSVYQLEKAVDTLSLTFREPVLSAKAKEVKERNERNRPLNITHNGKNGFEIYDTLCIRAERPVSEIWQDSIHLFQKVDTTYVPLEYTLSPVDSAHMAYHIIYAYEPQMQYELRIDSAAIRDIYGKACNKTKVQMRLKSLDEYATLRIRVKDFDSQIRLQLLDEKDQVVRELPAEPDGALFTHLTPKGYYLRLYIDRNGDKKWTTGDWATKRQPEPVYYFPKKLTLRANWDFDETFDHLAKEQLEAKPQALIKASAQNKKKR